MQKRLNKNVIPPKTNTKYMTKSKKNYQKFRADNLHIPKVGVPKAPKKLQSDPTVISKDHSLPQLLVIQNRELKMDSFHQPMQQRTSKLMISTCRWIMLTKIGVMFGNSPE